MPDLTAKRTLVKSPPELWEELSEVERLTKHLGAFGEIKITKLEPEHTVAWEGEHASGTVSIESSGWGTKVTLHAELPDQPEPKADQATAEPDQVAVGPAPEAVEREPEPDAVAPEPEPEAVKGEPEPEPVALKSEPVIVEPVSLPKHDPEPKRRAFWGWLFRSRTAGPASTPEPVAVDHGQPVGTQPDLVVTEPDPAVAEPASDVTNSWSVVTEPEHEPVVVGPEPVQAEPEPVQAEPERVEPEPVQAMPEPVEPEPVGFGADAEPPAAAAPLDPERAPLDPERARLVLDEALDALGAAHHRPFSRS